MRRSYMFGAGLMVLAATLATGCGDDDDDGDVSEANAAFCEDLGEYISAVGTLAALDPATATKDDYDDAVDELGSTREDMVESAADLSEAEWENLATQVDELRDQLVDAPDDVAVQSILQDAAAQAVTVQASAAAVNSAVCGVGTATDTTGG